MKQPIKIQLVYFQSGVRIFCDDPSVEKAVHSAVDKFNLGLAVGPKMALYQILSAAKVLQPHAGNNELWGTFYCWNLRTKGKKHDAWWNSKLNTKKYPFSHKCLLFQSLGKHILLDWRRFHFISSLHKKQATIFQLSEAQSQLKLWNSFWSFSAKVYPRTLTSGHTPMCVCVLCVHSQRAATTQCTPCSSPSGGPSVPLQT